MDFEEACAQMEYIINHIEPKEQAKIPQEIKKFFTQNNDYSYTINLDYTRSLSEEKLKEETEAFIEIIYNKYLKIEDNIKCEEDFKKEKELPTIVKNENFFNKLLTRIKNLFKRK